MTQETYQHPHVPAGYKHIRGEWDSGFVIRYIKNEFESESEFVWIPVGALRADGTQDGVHYDRQFGTRKELKYSGEPSLKVPEELAGQMESIEKYGGFYMSRYPVSLDDDGEPCSVARRVPVTMSLRSAAKTARRFEGGPDVSAHLPYAAEMDTMLAWLVQTENLTPREIREAAAVRESRTAGRKMPHACESHSRERNGFYDVLSNVDEWTQEQIDEPYLSGCGSGCSFPKTARCYFRPYACYAFTGFRIALRII